MAKLETIFSVMTWGVMNALLLAVAFDSSGNLDILVSPPAIHASSHALTA